MAYLNVDVLFARILNKEREGILPHRAVGAVAGLQERGEHVHYAHSSIHCTEKGLKVDPPHLALFSCILNGNLCHRARVLVAFPHLQQIKCIDLGTTRKLNAHPSERLFNKDNLTGSS